MKLIVFLLIVLQLCQAKLLGDRDEMNRMYYQQTKHQPKQQQKQEYPMLLLISFDGFRWDYLYHHDLKNFNRLKLMGSHADFIHNSFSTVTFPNHWTIVTGLYEESHGIVQNNIYDPKLNKSFSYTSPDSQTIEWFGQNKLAEPIWATNQRAGGNRRSVAEWVGANVVFNNQHIINIPYNKTRPYRELIDTFVSLFATNNNPVNFGALYFDEPDHTGHLYGPYSQEMKDKLQELDAHLGYLLDKLQAFNLFNKLNVIITSDHGMDTISKSTSIFLDSYIDTDLFDAYGSRACYSLFIKKAADTDYVYATLKNVKNIDVYKKNEIPDGLNYKLNVRIGDLIVVTHIGYAVYINNQTVNWDLNKGDHGYYNNESSMFPIFMAHGPAFKKQYKIKSFNNVDIYPLMCHILGVEPATNNGSLSNVIDMLVNGADLNDAIGFHLIVLILSITILLFVIVSLILYTLMQIGFREAKTKLVYPNHKYFLPSTCSSNVYKSIVSSKNDIGTKNNQNEKEYFIY